MGLPARRLITLAVVLNAALCARFGADSDQPIFLRRPGWHLPWFDDELGRLWDVLFRPSPSDDEPEHSAAGYQTAG